MAPIFDGKWRKSLQIRNFVEDFFVLVKYKDYAGKNT